MIRSSPTLCWSCLMTWDTMMCPGTTWTWSLRTCRPWSTPGSDWNRAMSSHCALPPEQLWWLEDIQYTQADNIVTSIIKNLKVSMPASHCCLSICKHWAIILIWWVSGTWASVTSHIYPPDEDLIVTMATGLEARTTINTQKYLSLNPRCQAMISERVRRWPDLPGEHTALICSLTELERLSRIHQATLLLSFFILLSKVFMVLFRFLRSMKTCTSTYR